jgi:hypothetical protein
MGIGYRGQNPKPSPVKRRKILKANFLNNYKKNN